MIVKLEQIPSREEIEVLIRYAKMNKLVRRLESVVKSFANTVKCSLEGSEVLINTSDIYYIESVDKKSFVYCDKEVYRTESRLYQLMEELAECGFVQISKSCIINVNMLAAVRPLPNSRIEATLKNGERVNITRKYLAGIRSKLNEI